MGSRRGGSPASLCRKIALIKIQVTDIWGHAVRQGISFRNSLILSLQLTPSQCCLHCSSDSCCSSLPPWWAHARKAIRGYFSMPYKFCHLPRTPGTISQFFSSSQITAIWIISSTLSLIHISREGKGHLPNRGLVGYKNPGSPSGLWGLLLLVSLMPMAA